MKSSEVQPFLSKEELIALPVEVGSVITARHNCEQALALNRKIIKSYVGMININEGDDAKAIDAYSLEPHQAYDLANAAVRVDAAEKRLTGLVSEANFLRSKWLMGLYFFPGTTYRSNPYRPRRETVYGHKSSWRQYFKNYSALEWQATSPIIE